LPEVVDGFSAVACSKRAMARSRSYVIDTVDISQKGKSGVGAMRNAHLEQPVRVLVRSFAAMRSPQKRR